LFETGCGVQADWPERNANNCSCSNTQLRARCRDWCGYGLETYRHESLVTRHSKWETLDLYGLISPELTAGLNPALGTMYGAPAHPG
jgi:hypothetical protein